jgi:hypothetical protein
LKESFIITKLDALPCIHGFLAYAVVDTFSTKIIVAADRTGSCLTTPPAGGR